MSDLLLDKQGVHPDAAAIAHQIRDTQLAKIEAMIAGSRPWAALMPRRALHGMMTENDMQQLGTALCHPRRPRDPWQTAGHSENGGAPTGHSARRNGASVRSASRRRPKAGAHRSREWF